MENILIIGGGQAGFSCAAKLRASGFEGIISIACEEKTFPYQRPPLSKKYLTGQFEINRLLLRPEEYYKKNNIEVLLSTKASEIKKEEKKVVFQVGEVRSYTKLVLSTGSSATKIFSQESNNCKNIYYLRNLKDADKIKGCLEPNKKILIIGGGYLGLEIGSIASIGGMSVTIVESNERILKRVAGPQTADFLRSIFQKNGVQILENVAVESLGVEGNIISEIKLASGETVETDVVVVAVGGKPVTDLAQRSGLDIDLGIKVNKRLQTNDISIYAAGDCASFDFNGKRVRFESVGNAIDQGETVALNLMGKNVEYNIKPWFWSDQFDLKLQIAGLSEGSDEIIKRSYKNSISFWYYTNKKLTAVDSFNDPTSYFVGKRLIDDGKSISKEVVSDVNSNLKDFLLNK